MEGLRRVARGLVCMAVMLVTLPLAALVSLFSEEDPADTYNYRNL